ncbi:DoxX family protein [Tengunoibacter tsumagoiensis]|uniref:Quinol oxidase n=1 Tax=Tengunoibacter tsumagoiensis TaxID=2014871 RepID=A0A402A3Q6_9CHLR|nr:DoxX family protein [Tengunoibacter tsumagoiensis]GCE13679.1 quinol oxidase [Tengunoibacter tsumagoiensis]
MKTYPQFAPVVLRLMLAIIFLVHGVMKFQHLAGTAQFFEHIGIPAPVLMVPTIGLLEIIGGIALLLGIGSRIFAFLLAVDMLVAILTAKILLGFYNGYEYEVLLIACLISLVLSGPGTLSLIKNRDSLFA